MQKINLIPSKPEHWLIPKEALLAINLLLEFEPKKRLFLEIGLLHGAWSINLLKNVKNSEGHGIDPFPNLDQIKDGFLSDVADQPFRLFESWSSYDHREKNLSIIHIDGLHTQKAVEIDMKNSLRILSNDGILIIDDYLHPYFPGIPAAIYQGIKEYSLSPFLCTGSKIYLCKNKYHEHWYRKLEKKLMSQDEIPWCRYWGEGYENAYVSPPEINGCKVLLSPERYEIKSSNTIQSIWPDQPDFSKPQVPLRN